MALELTQRGVNNAIQRSRITQETLDHITDTVDRLLQSQQFKAIVGDAIALYEQLLKETRKRPDGKKETLIGRVWDWPHWMGRFDSHIEPLKILTLLAIRDGMRWDEPGILPETTPNSRGVFFRTILSSKGYTEPNLIRWEKELSAKWQKLPLGKTARLIYNKLKTLPDQEAMTAPEICKWLTKEHKIILDESSIYKDHKKNLLQHGILHHPRIGFYFRG